MCPKQQQVRVNRQAVKRAKSFLDKRFWPVKEPCVRQNFKRAMLSILAVIRATYRLPERPEGCEGRSKLQMMLNSKGDR